MSNEEFTTTNTIVYDVRGIDNSIRSSQRLLFSVNALRLGVEDFKRLSEDPSFGNLLWTGIQLTRIWTNVFRLVKASNQAQRFGLAGAISGGAGAARGAASVNTGLAIRNLFGEQLGFGDTVASKGLWTAVTGFASSNPITAGVIIGAVVTAGVVANTARQRRVLEEWRQRQREIAKSQGLEN